MRVAVVIFALFAASAFASEYEPQTLINGMQGLRITCDTKEKHDFVREFEKIPGFDFARLQRDPTAPIDVFVPAGQLEPFKRAIAANGISYEVFVDDVGQVVREQQQQQQQQQARRGGDSNDLLESFPTYSQITSYLETLALTHSRIVKLINIGTTHEGRDILGVKITSADGRPGPRPAVLIDAGIHAREWIAPTTAIYAIRQLAENASNSGVFENVDIYVVPSINPDGYEYSHKVDRMWRKNRSPPASIGCFGTDINRNFDYDWRHMGNQTCYSTYGGPRPFSERESQALRHFIESEKESLKVYISLHSYGNYFLHPWGAKPELPKNRPELECAAAKAEAQLSKIRGEHYQIGSSYNLLYPIYGGSKDWIMGVAGVDLAYTIELPSEEYGFLAPASEIIPVGREMFEAIKVFAKYAEGKICRAA